MTSSFAVTTTAGSVNIGSGRQSSVSYTVTNRRGQACRGRVSVVALEGARQDWFWLPGDIERHFEPEETHHFEVEVRIPPDANPGTYALRLDVVAEDNPDEDYAQGPSVAFTVYAASEPIPDEPAGYLRTIIGTAIGGFTGLAVGVILAIIVGVILAAIADDISGVLSALVITMLLFIPGPWIGAAAGSWLALRMGDYTRSRRTGLLMAGVFPIWALLHIILIAQLSGRVNGVVLALMVLIFVAPSWIVLPAIISRFAALRIGGARRASTASSQPAST